MSYFNEGHFTVSVSAEGSSQGEFTCNGSTMDLMIMKFLPSSPMKLLDEILDHTIAHEAGELLGDDYFSVSTCLAILGHYYEQCHFYKVEGAWRE